MSVQILLIDDEKYLPGIIREYLEDETDFQIDIAASAEEALTVCDTMHPDLCMVDMRLPGMTGNEFIQAAHEKIPKCKFIIHTGSLDYQIPAELIAIGVTNKSILFKPVIRMTKFIEKIEELLGCE